VQHRYDIPKLRERKKQKGAKSSSTGQRKKEYKKAWLSVHALSPLKP
jgi:hypothetical protein